MLLSYCCKYLSSRQTLMHLKKLNLKLPTSQSQIKSTYRSLAKQHHPDTISSSTNPQLFTQLTTSYNYLKQIPQTQLSLQQQAYNINLNAKQKQEIKTKEQQMREQTYSYFSKKRYSQIKKDPANNKPLYKTIPELFIGTAFVLVMFGEWAYKSMKKTDHQIKNQRHQHNPHDKPNHTFQSVFRGFNAAKRFKKTQIQTLTQKIPD